MEILMRTEPEGNDLGKIFANAATYVGGIWHFHGARRADYASGSEILGPLLDELALPELSEPPETLAAKLLPPDELPWPAVARLATDQARLNERLRAPYATENWALPFWNCLRHDGCPEKRGCHHFQQCLCSLRFPGLHQAFCRLGAGESNSGFFGWNRIHHPVRPRGSLLVCRKGRMALGT
ncbi:MAG: hypothetical protein EB056_03280 [Verrucomicrobia bacterium]|nr:hypothetical protein [Verrucomicrobiota bacterium]